MCCRHTLSVWVSCVRKVVSGQSLVLCELGSGLRAPRSTESQDLPKDGWRAHFAPRDQNYSCIAPLKKRSHSASLPGVVRGEKKKDIRDKGVHVCVTQSQFPGRLANKRTQIPADCVKRATGGRLMISFLRKMQTRLRNVCLLCKASAFMQFFFLSVCLSVRLFEMKSFAPRNFPDAFQGLILCLSCNQGINRHAQLLPFYWKDAASPAACGLHPLLDSPSLPLLYDDDWRKERRISAVRRRRRRGVPFTLILPPSLRC